MISEKLKNIIFNNTLLYRALKFYYCDIPTLRTSAEMLIGSGPYRSHFEIYGVSEHYIEENFWVDYKDRIIHHEEDRIEFIFNKSTARPSQKNDRIPSSLDFFIKDNKIVKLKFWFIPPNKNEYSYSLAFDVVNMTRCSECGNYFDINVCDDEFICPHCGLEIHIIR